MQVSATSNPPTSATALAGDTGDMFLKLLTAQLKQQDPLSPMDPTAFVSQLVQFNTLGEIMKIRELLQSGISPESTATRIAAPDTTPAATIGDN
jgi:flagellar basal-body rod modification protein FlgD